MSNSFEKINYKIRRNKCAERKMIAESLSSLHGLLSYKNYSYIGLGAIDFVDFKLMHKILDIDSMFSIEENENVQRFQFNLPYSFVSIINETSSEAIKEIIFLKEQQGLKPNNFWWLDYDSTFQRYMVDDLEEITLNAIKGDILLFTCSRRGHSVSGAADNDSQQQKFEDFCAEFEGIIPLLPSPEGTRPIKKNDLTVNNIMNVIYHVTISQIYSILKDLNIANPDTKLKFQPIFFFEYSDAAPMVSIGGIFLDITDLQTVEVLKQYDYIRTSPEPFKINLPILTSKEIHLLKKYVPFSQYNAVKTQVEKTGLNEEDITIYNSFYKYYPHFFEALE